MEPRPPYVSQIFSDAFTPILPFRSSPPLAVSAVWHYKVQATSFAYGVHAYYANRATSPEPCDQKDCCRLVLYRCGRRVARLKYYRNASMFHFSHLITPIFFSKYATSSTTTPSNHALSPPHPLLPHTLLTHPLLSIPKHLHNASPNLPLRPLHDSRPRHLRTPSRRPLGGLRDILWRWRRGRMERWSGLWDGLRRRGWRRWGSVEEV
jgi:hypothetical protein